MRGVLSCQEGDDITVFILPIGIGGEFPWLPSLPLPVGDDPSPDNHTCDDDYKYFSSELSNM